MVTRLNDYLRAERPDLTEPASFYVPGARNWKEAGFRHRRVDEEEEEAGPPLDTTHTQDIDQLEAAQEAAKLKSLEG